MMPPLGTSWVLSADKLQGGFKLEQFDPEGRSERSHAAPSEQELIALLPPTVSPVGRVERLEGPQIRGIWMVMEPGWQGTCARA